MDHPQYSVLMSVYVKERPRWLRESLDSVLAQSVPPTEVVVVKDGPLTPDLESVFADYDLSYPGLFRFVSYPENRGLGYALSCGIKACSNEIVARMDTDDYSFPNRMERQLEIMVERRLDMVGSNVTEFIESWDRPVAKTDLPETHDEIAAYSKRRNPFRHPSMVFLRSKVLAAGGYNGGFPYFEDWDLFNRMLASGCRAANLREPLVAMRVSEDFYMRRGGWQYLTYAYRFKIAQFHCGYFTLFDYLASFLPHAVVCLMPNCLRGFFYKSFLRKGGDALWERPQQS